MANSDRLLLILGNQLFPFEHLEAYRGVPVFMAEDHGLCTYVRHHQQKIVLFLAAMRSYRDALRERGFEVHYAELPAETDLGYEERLGECMDDLGARELLHFEIEDRPFERRIRTFADERGLVRTELESPMFLCSRQRFASFVEGKGRPLMAEFYKQERRRLGILIDASGGPVGEQWSFDAENRKKLPKNLQPPSLGPAPGNENVDAVTSLVAERFSAHPGDASDFWWPTTRRDALAWLDDFVATRLAEFGPYEDAMSTRSATVFHSLLSPSLNLGLITPRDVLDRVMECADSDVPIASLEGFVRQLIGWREFIRGIYRNYGAEQEERNFWAHERELTSHWYEGATGIVPLDDTVRTALRLGWTHHIPRLMVAANLMTLCEVRPSSAHLWFMEMYVDSSEWVMGPNVYGMGLFSDGGIFATKPYICGSNYLRKMSDYPKGDWCDTVDGLYWRFIDRHRDFFAQQPRLALMPKALDRLDSKRRKSIFEAAEKFLERYTA